MFCIVKATICDNKNQQVGSGRGRVQLASDSLRLDPIGCPAVGSAPVSVGVTSP